MSKNKKIDQQKRKKKRLIISIISAAAALCVIITAVSIGVVKYREESGFELHNTVALQSKNYKISNAELSYFFKSAYDDFKSNHSQSLGAMGLDVNAKLKDQKCTYYDGYDTWYDYFLSEAQKRVEKNVSYAEAAKEMGMELSDDEKSKIDSSISSMEQTAKNDDKTLDEYIAENYGKGVKSDDIRAAMELSLLANKYYEDYDSKTSYTDKQIIDYYNKSPEKYNVVDLKKYEIPADTNDTDSTDEAEENAMSAKAAADKIASAKNEAQFNSLLKAYLTDYYKNKGSVKTDKQLNSIISSTLQTGFEYNKSTEVTKWAFDKSRKVGDTTVIEDGDNDCYIVYILIKTQYKQNYLTKNVRHMLFTSDTYGSQSDALTAAQDMIDEINHQSDKQAAFIERAKKYSEDAGSAKNGGLYENVKKGETVDSFDEWCYYSGRKKGDMAVIFTTYGYHAMYFVGNGVPAWQVNVIDAMKTEQYANNLETLKTTYDVKFDMNAAKKLDK